MKTQLTSTELRELLTPVFAVRDRLSMPIWEPAEMGYMWDGDTVADAWEQMASFNYLQPQIVTLGEWARRTPELMVPYVVHELRHKWQLQTLGVVRYMLALVVRKWTLEPSAYTVQHEAAQFFGLNDLVPECDQ